MSEFLRPERAVSTRMLLVFSITLVVITTLFRAFVPRDFFAPVRAATGGWVSGTLILALVLFPIAGWFLFRWGRLSWNGLGWNRRDFVIGAFGTIAFWLLMQGVQALLFFFRGQAIPLHSIWQDPGLGVTMGTLIGQLMTNTPFEETIFRRFYLTQLCHRFGKIRPFLLRLITAVLVSQLFFWVMHFPAALQMGIPPELLVSKTDIILVAGFVFTWIYLQTRNLFLCMGYHALANAPTPLVGEAVNAYWLTQRAAWGLLVLHLLWIGGRWLWTRRRNRSAAHVIPNSTRAASNSTRPYSNSTGAATTDPEPE